MFDSEDNFAHRRALEQQRWARTFVCPNCGRCNVAMVMTTKSCLCCGAGLTRNVPLYMPAHGRRLKHGAKHKEFCSAKKQS